MNDRGIELYFDGRFYATVSREFWEAALIVLEEDGKEEFISALSAEGYIQAQVYELTAIARVQLRDKQGES